MGIFDIFSAAPGQKAAQDQIAALAKGKDEGDYAFGQGRSDLNTNYAKALQAYGPYASNAATGTSGLMDALGLNGPEGSARAQRAFQTNPGLQYAQQQGQNAVLANAAKTGGLGSGNTMLDLMKQSQGLANQQFGQYTANLQPFLGAQGSAASGMAGIDTGLGNALNTNWGNQAGLDYGANTSIGKAQAGGDLAGQQASGNLWGAGLAALGDVSQMFGGGGGAKAAKSLFGGFGAA